MISSAHKEKHKNGIKPFDRKCVSDITLTLHLEMQQRTSEESPATTKVNNYFSGF